MVGFGKISLVGPGEWWLEGLRVHPEYQGMKIGSRLTEYLVGEWRKRGGGVIRLATSSERVQVHHVCNRLGFRRAGICRVMAAKPVTRGACEFQPVTEAEKQEAIAFWKHVPAAWKTPDYINDGWKWGRFTEARLVEFIRRGDAWWWRSRSAILLTYDSDHDNQPSLEVAAALSPLDTLAPMLRQLRVLAHSQKAGRVAWAMPDTPRLVQAVRRTGFTSAWDARLWLFELSDSSSG
jgi:hypothetical protein